MSNVRWWIRASIIAAILFVACAAPTFTATPTPSASPSSSAGFIALLQQGGTGCIDISSAPWESTAGDAGVRLHVGEAVAIALVVPEHDVSDVFPWVTPTSSDSSVLSPEVICPQTPSFSSLPISRSVFRAVGVGQATITAPLSAAWSPPPDACVPVDCQPLVSLALTVVVSR